MKREKKMKKEKQKRNKKWRQPILKAFADLTKQIFSHLLKIVSVVHARVRILLALNLQLNLNAFDCFYFAQFRS